MSVVDMLEAVQINEDQRERHLAASRVCQCLSNAILEQQSIWQAGQGVVVGQVGQAVFDVEQVLDVGKYSDESRIGISMGIPGVSLTPGALVNC